MYVNGEIYAELGKRGNTHWDKNLGEICRSFYFVVHSVFQVSVVANHVWMVVVERLWAAHPDGLDDLEHGGPDHHEHKQTDEFWADGVSIISLARLLDIAAFRHVLGVLFVRLAHLWCHRHLESLL